MDSRQRPLQPRSTLQATRIRRGGPKPHIGIMAAVNLPQFMRPEPARTVVCIPTVKKHRGIAMMPQSVQNIRTFTVAGPSAICESGEAFGIRFPLRCRRHRPRNPVGALRTEEDNKEKEGRPAGYLTAPNLALLFSLFDDTTLPAESGQLNRVIEQFEPVVLYCQILHDLLQSVSSTSSARPHFVQIRW